LRGLRRAPAFSLLVILTLTFGIGANTAIFSVVYSVLLRPLPYPLSERLLWLGESAPQGSGISVTWINFQHWRRENHTFEDMAGFAWSDLALTGRGPATLTHAGVASSSFLKLAGARPLLGRLLSEADDRPGARPAIALTEEFWSKRLGGDPAIIGQQLALNGTGYEVVGVLHPGFQYLAGHVDCVLPLGRTAGLSIKRSEHGSMRVLGLLKNGVTLQQARNDLDNIMKRLAVADPGPESDHRSAPVFLTESITGDVRKTLLMLMGAVGLVLVIACANVASLLLVRGTARRREVAIRGAIGAGPMRIARQLLTENFVITTIGGIAGLISAALCVRLLAVRGAAGIPRLAETCVDDHVLMFAAVVTALVALAAGMAPVLALRRIDLTAALKEGSSASGSDQRGRFVRTGLVVGEIAITLVLAFSSGLLLRSLIAAESADPGFVPDHVLTLEMQLPSPAYKSDTSSRLFYNRLMEKLRQEPGVESVGAVQSGPSAGDNWDWFYSIGEGSQPSRGEVPLSLFNVADTSYFDTMRMRLVAGRKFSDTDREGGPQIAVVNEVFARRWPDARQAIGHHIKYGGPFLDGPTYEIVGVVGNVSQLGLDSEPLPEVYLPFSQKATQALMVMIRTRGEPGALIPAVRRGVAALDRDVPVQSLRPLTEWLGASLARRKFSALLLTGFTAVAMFLAAIGIYGVLNYWISIRQKEIALRMALGARQVNIVRWAGAHVVRLVAAGLVIGIAANWAASRWLSALVFGLSPWDVQMLTAAAMFVVLIAVLAAAVPLWRAVNVDPVRNLHDA
jgi:putative ABC transport system permease protein